MAARKKKPKKPTSPMRIVFLTDILTLADAKAQLDNILIAWTALDKFFRKIVRPKPRVIFRGERLVIPTSKRKR